VFSGYVYYVVRPAQYQAATSFLKAAALSASVLAGILGDLLVVEGGASLDVLMWISCVSVCAGFAVGLFVLRPTRKSEATSTTGTHAVATKGDNDRQDDGPSRSSLHPVVRCNGDRCIHDLVACLYACLLTITCLTDLSPEDNAGSRGDEAAEVGLTPFQMKLGTFKVVDM